MAEVSVLVSVLTVSTVVVTSVYIVMEKRRPTATLAWLLAVVFLPYLGLLLYIGFGRRKMRRTRKRIRVRENYREGLPTAPSADGVRDEFGLWRLVSIQEDEPVTIGNRVEVLLNSSETYPALYHAIDSAEAYVLAEYYIVQPDETGERFRDRLVAAAERGVRVTFLYDAVGCWSLGADFFAPLHAAGVQVASFMPLRFSRLRLRWNFRTHRKLLVVDGRVGFTGGLNIGREYEGKDPVLGAWRDTHMRIEGPAVRSMERVFHDDWHLAVGEDLESERYFPDVGSFDTGEAAQILPSGPDRRWVTIHLHHFVAISTARERCYITTPYFVPDEAIRVALVTAAMRGVDVRLLLPRKSDLGFVRWAGRSYYGELLSAGVRIFEFTGGFLHAKTLVVDSHIASVGSANMDTRSFYLNFELNVGVYGSTVATRLEEIFRDDCEHAVEILQESFDRRPRRQKVVESVARMLGPLL